MSSKFIQHLTVKKQHIDNLQHVNNVQFLFWAQEIAKAHWEKLTENADFEIGIWVVRSHQIEYRSNAEEGDKIRIETYVDSVRGPLSNRNVKFYDDLSEKLLVKSQTQWCYLNPKTRKPIPVSKKITALFLGQQ